MGGVLFFLLHQIQLKALLFLCFEGSHNLTRKIQPRYKALRNFKLKIISHFIMENMENIQFIIPALIQ